MPTLPGQPGAESLSDCIPCRAGTYRCVKDNFYDLIIEEMFAQFVIQTLRTIFYQEKILRSKFLVMLNLGLDRITVSNVRQVLIMHSREIYFALPVTLDFIARILECLERV